MNAFNLDKWMQEFYSPKELEEFKQLMAKFPTTFWDEYNQQWQNMFKKIEEHLWLDPKSKEAKTLYDEWMELVNKVYGNYPNLREKIWEAYKMGVKFNLKYFNQQVIDFIDKVSKFYK